MHSSSSGIFAWLVIVFCRSSHTTSLYLQHLVLHKHPGKHCLPFPKLRPGLSWFCFFASLNAQSRENLDMSQFPKCLDSDCSPGPFFYQRVSLSKLQDWFWDFASWRILWPVSSQSFWLKYFLPVIHFHTAFSIPQMY